MPALTSIPRVVIAGGGPGGHAAASLLREAGAIVTVVEKAIAGEVLAARRGSVIVGREAWSVLRRVGGGSLIDDARNAVSPTEQLMSLRRMDATLGEFAAARGATFIRGAAVEGVQELDDAATGVRVTIRDTGTGATEVLEADWFIDATAGGTSLARDPRFERRLAEGPYRMLPAERRFVGMRATAQDTPKLGWSGPNDAFAINDPVEGILSAYRPIAPGVSAAARPTAADGTALLEAVGVHAADAIDQPFTFTVRQTMANHAAAGRILLVGDSVGTVMPVTQAGAMLALTDADRAARTIMAAAAASSADEAASIVRRYDTETIAIHRAFLR